MLDQATVNKFNNLLQRPTEDIARMSSKQLWDYRLRVESAQRMLKEEIDKFYTLHLQRINTFKT